MRERKLLCDDLRLKALLLIELAYSMSRCYRLSQSVLCRILTDCANLFSFVLLPTEPTDSMSGCYRLS
jgi:hypothetical protein